MTNQDIEDVCVLGLCFTAIAFFTTALVALPRIIVAMA